MQTDDPRTLMRLMRHTNLTTTTKYLLAEQDRMKDAVKNLGATLGATQNTSRGQKTVQNDMLAQLAQMLISGGSMGNLMRKTTAVDGAVIAKLTDGCHTSGKSDA